MTYKKPYKGTYPEDMDKRILEKMVKSPGKSLSAWGPQLEVLPPVAAEQLRSWWQRARRVYPDATLKAWRCDWVIYAGFREPRHLSSLPANPETIAGFVVYCKEAGKKTSFQF